MFFFYFLAQLKIRMSESGPDSSPVRPASRPAVQPLTLELLMSAVTALCEQDRKGASVHVS